MKRYLALIAGAGLLLAGFILWWPRTPLHQRTVASADHTGQAAGQKPIGPVGPIGPILPITPTAPVSPSRELDPALNPYAGALHEPGKEKRTWDPLFLTQYQGVPTNTPIQFELTAGRIASGTIRLTQYRDGQLSYISGDLAEPEPGKFFFLAPPAEGKAGKAVGVIEFPASKTAYRIEPTGPNGGTELWQRHLDEVLCQLMPLIDPNRAKDVVEIPPLRPDSVPDYAPDYNSNIVSLQSYPGSSAVLLLDFFGGYTPTWGGVSYPRPDVSNAQIKDLWKRVAEDYMAFDINVTTDIRVYLSAPATSRQKCVFTPSTSAMPAGAAGVAYIGSWNWGSDTVCWSIYTSGKAGAEVGAHEPGHTLGLGHQGTSTSGYFGGQGSGATGWAPIMGVGYYQPVSTWAKGEYQDANNHEDELNIITTANNNVTYRPDDTGSTLATSRYLEVYPGNSAFAEGVIERTGDTDAFQFTTGGGQVSLTVNAVGDWADLALMATLANSSDTMIASNNPQNVLSASITTNLTSGTYTFRVTGAGRNSPLTNGFSPYASLGYYSVTGSVAAARLPTRLSVNEHSPVGTLVGTVYPLSTNNLFSYSIVAGNIGGTFSIDSHGVVRVANNTLLDYRRLATNTMLAVQFQLLVNIVDLVNPSLTESSRRVVISVLNVNDAPVVTGFAASVLEHTQIGTMLGSLTVADPDFSENFSFSIVSGDPNGSFAVDDFGSVFIAKDLSASIQNSYTLAVAVNDNFIVNPLIATGYVNVTVISNLTAFSPGSISYALYDNIGSGTLVSDLTSNARWPRDPSSELQMPTFEGLMNRADSYGAAMRGFLIPPQSGSYTFWIASDDSSELWISTTTNPASISRIAYVNGYTAPRQWTAYASQQSAPIALTAGQGYYIEARMKEGGGNDNLAVAWKGPATANQTNVISGSYLAPYFMNYVPHLAGFSTTMHQGAFTGTPIGTVAVSDVNALDAHTFSITAGNAAGLFTIDPNSGTLHVADQAALLAAAPGAYTLQVTAVDSGSPPLSTNASVTINLVASNAITATSLRREIWNNIGGGTAVSDLTNNAAYPGRPDTLEVLSSFASAVNIADNYGSRIRALLTPTSTGSYRFFIASDDNSSLLLSTDANASNAVRVAYVPGWTAVSAWTTYGQQISAPVNLVAGQPYYIEALQKEGGGGDHVEVAWTGPGIVDSNGLPTTNVIGGSFLTPVDLNYPPQINNQSLPVSSSIPNNTPIGRAAALDSVLDSLSFKIVAGNTNGMFAIEPSTGVISVLDNMLIANGTLTSFPLTVAVQDSGYGGLYAPLSSQATVTINVQPTSTFFVWTGASGTNDWANPGNWAGALPSDGALLTFGFPLQQANRNDQLNSVAWVQLTNSGFNLSGRSLQIQSGVTNRGDNTWNVPTTLSAAQTWLNASGTFAIAGPITNNGFALTLIANSDLNLAGSVSGSGGLNKSGTARLLMQGAHTYTGPTVIAPAGGTTSLQVNGPEDLDIRNSDLTLYGRMDLGSHDALIGSLSGNGLIFATDLTRTLTLGANDHSGTFAGILQDSGSSSGSTLNLVKIGAGIQTLSGANTYSGLTVVRSGVLALANAGALGNGAGSAVVISGATLSLANNIIVASEPLTLNGSGLNGSGALRNDSGVNAFNGPLTLGGATTIAAPSGRLTLGGAWNTGGNSGDLTFNAGSGTIISVSNGILGGGGLIKAGPGTLILNGTNSYTGLTTLNQGQVTLGGQASLSATPAITLASATLDVSRLAGGWVLGPAQTLQGSGIVAGTAIINGTLAPGPSIAQITVTGSAFLAGNTFIKISKDSGVLTNDILASYSTLTLGGSLTVTKTGADSLALGDSFKLFSAAFFAPSSFASINLPALPGGLAWDATALSTSGTIRVEPAAPPVLGFGSASGILSLSWSTQYSSYLLQGQTNPLGQGLGPLWYSIAGVTNNSISFPIDLNNGSAFYRLSKP